MAYDIHLKTSKEKYIDYVNNTDIERYIDSINYTDYRNSQGDFVGCIEYNTFKEIFKPFRKDFSSFLSNFKFLKRISWFWGDAEFTKEEISELIKDIKKLKRKIRYRKKIRYKIKKLIKGLESAIKKSEFGIFFVPD